MQDVITETWTQVKQQEDIEEFVTLYYRYLTRKSRWMGFM